jgi:transglutaminase superfamily protein
MSLHFWTTCAGTASSRPHRNSVFRSVARVLALSSRDRGLLVDAYVRLTTVDVALRLGGFRMSAPRPRPTRAARVPLPQLVAAAERYAYWLDVAARRHVVRARCLHRSLALSGWLSQRGVPCELRIGVQKRQGTLAAHAWVEVGGLAIAEPLDAIAGFVPLQRQPGRLNGFSTADMRMFAPLAGLNSGRRASGGAG